MEILTKMKIFVSILLCMAFLDAGAQNIWQFSSNFPGINRHAGISFSINEKGYIGTGFSSNNQWLQDMWEYDPTTASWSQKANFPIWVYAATSFTIDSFVYVTNGWETQSANS